MSTILFIAAVVSIPPGVIAIWIIWGRILDLLRQDAAPWRRSPELAQIEDDVDALHKELAGIDLDLQRMLARRRVVAGAIERHYGGEFGAGAA